MNMPTSHKIVTVLLAVALPGGVFLLFFPRHTESVYNGIKYRIQRYREAREGDNL